MENKIKQTEQNITKALEDYSRHTYKTEVMDSCSQDFIHRLAVDSVAAKQDLRNLFSKSNAWNEELDCLVINGNRTHEPDPDVILETMREIFKPVFATCDTTTSDLLYQVMAYFFKPNFNTEAGIEAINKLAPKAYAPNKKPSRVFKAICVALGIADESRGSKFQRLFAKFADEISAKEIGYKLYVSINPAHFLTMSNPKEDNRGMCLTSCHSFNSLDYTYNNGCSGYARDKTSFIVFTVADDKSPETFNNRKTSRQIFAYQHGVLLQSRMYNTCGGVHGAVEESRVYRHLVQAEIASLEGVPNLWKTHSSTGDYSHLIIKNRDFGGYPDWVYPEFDGKISTLTTYADDFTPIIVGASGLCVGCGEEISESLYCDDCSHLHAPICNCCNQPSDEELIEAHNWDGTTILICNRCFENDYYNYCYCCEECYDSDMLTYVEYEAYCPECLEERCTQCIECEDYFLDENVYRVTDSNGHTEYVCENCHNESYAACDICEETYHVDSLTNTNDDKCVCQECLDDNYFCCDQCDSYVPMEEQVEVVTNGSYDLVVCRSCAESFDTCSNCYIHCNYPLADVEGNMLCNECLEERED